MPGPHHRAKVKQKKDRAKMSLVRARKAVKKKRWERWTKYEKATLVRLWGTMPRKEVAAKLGRTINACKSQLNRLSKSTWSRRYAQCIDCNTTNRKHSSHGRCTICRSRFNRMKVVKISYAEFLALSKELNDEINRKFDAGFTIHLIKDGEIIARSKRVRLKDDED